VYKGLDLAVLSLFLPWVDLSGVGRGVITTEGILVLGKTTAVVLVYVFVYNLLQARHHVHFVFRLYLLSVAVVVVVGMVQIFVLGHPVITSTFRNMHALSQRVPGIWGVEDPWLGESSVGHEHLGAFMVLACSVLGAMLFCKYPARKGPRQLLAALWVGCIFTLIYSASRGAWFGGVCALVVLLWFVLKRQGGLKFFVAVSIGVVAIALLLKWTWELDALRYIQGRIPDLSRDFSGVIRDDSAKTRIGLFWGLVSVFLSSPIVGWGPGGAGRIAEGQWIRELVEGGIMGGMLFFALMLRSGGSALRSHRQSEDPLVQGVSMGFVCGLVGLLGQSFFTELFILTKVGVPFWVLAAVVHRLYRLEQQRLAAS
jgi:hypothetical protein